MAPVPSFHSAVCPAQSSFSRVHQSKFQMKSLFLVSTYGTCHALQVEIHREGQASCEVLGLKLADCLHEWQTLWRLWSNMEQFQLRTPYYTHLELGLMSNKTYTDNMLQRTWEHNSKCNLFSTIFSFIHTPIHLTTHDLQRILPSSP